MAGQTGSLRLALNAPAAEHLHFIPSIGGGDERACSCVRKVIACSPWMVDLVPCCGCSPLQRRELSNELSIVQKTRPARRKQRYGVRVDRRTIAVAVAVGNPVPSKALHHPLCSIVVTSTGSVA